MTVGLFNNYLFQRPLPYTITKHYYKGTTNNEQSLDVYEPYPVSARNDENENENVDASIRPTVVLIMGSGWLGHQWWIYAGTNWWNASGAATLAKLGYRTISVRHSGGFFQVPSLKYDALCIVVVTIFGILLRTVTTFQQGGLTLDVIQFPKSETYDWLLRITLFLLALWAFLAWQGKGAAQLDDMIEDVADALHFIHDDLLVKLDNPSSDKKKKKNNNNNKPPSIVLGGYSSGGHVLAILLSQHWDKIIDLKPHEWIHGIFYLSGVLSLDSTLMNAVTLAVFGMWASNVPSPYTALSGRQSLPPPSHPFRHLILGCRHETFGIPILDATFCAEQYAEYLINMASSSTKKENEGQNTIQARCVLVDSNHWSVLNSFALSEALQEHLPWLWDASRQKNPSTVSSRSTKITPQLQSTTVSRSNSSNEKEVGDAVLIDHNN